VTLIGYSTVVKDSVSCFTGKITGFDEWINGCVRYRVESEFLKDGSPILPEAFSAEQLLIIRKPDEAKPPVRTGGPMKNPSKAAGSRW